jgi:hypothetical protein
MWAEEKKKKKRRNQEAAVKVGERVKSRWEKMK